MSSSLPTLPQHSDPHTLIGKGFSVAHLNIRSIKNKIEEIAHILHYYPLDVLTISETWLTSHTESTILMVDGFDLNRADRAKTPSRPAPKKGGGLLTYSSLKCTSDPALYKDRNVCNEHIETQIISIKREGDRTAVIINVYRPPSGDLVEAQTTLDTTLQKVSLERFADIYLLGDLNIDHTPSKISPPAANLISMLHSHGLAQKITTPTRVSKTSKTIIDVVYIKSNKNITPFTITLALSDHYLVGCSRSLTYKKDPSTHFYGRSYRHYNLDKVRTYYKL